MYGVIFDRIKFIFNTAFDCFKSLLEKRLSLNESNEISINDRIVKGFVLNVTFQKHDLVCTCSIVVASSSASST